MLTGRKSRRIFALMSKRFRFKVTGGIGEWTEGGRSVTELSPQQKDIETSNVRPEFRAMMRKHYRRHPSSNRFRRIGTDELRALKDETGWNRDQIARAAGCNPTRVQDCLAGRRASVSSQSSERLIEWVRDFRMKKNHPEWFLTA